MNHQYQHLALRRQDTLCVSGTSGSVSIMELDTGEVVGELAVPRGSYTVGALIRNARRGRILIAGNGVKVIRASAGGYAQRGDGHFESAANPSYRVTNAMRLARNLEASLRRQEVLERSVTAKLEALKRAGENQIPLPVDPPEAEAEDPKSDEAPAAE